MNPSPDLGLLVDEILAELHGASPAAAAYDAHLLYVRRALPFARALAARARRSAPDDRRLSSIDALLAELERDADDAIFADLRTVTCAYRAPHDASDTYRDLMSELAALDEHFAQRLRR
jgi:hypothetical protein